MKSILTTILCLTFTFSGMNLNAQETKADDIYYEIFVRSFCDSNKDGIGDLKGITSKLGYLQTLGITGLWLTPIHPSPTYHKYDVVDYTAIDPEYGTLEDFKTLVKEAHKRRIKIMMDFVVNHSSSRHPWFLQSSKPRSFYKEFYNWSDTVKTANNWHSNPLNPQEKYYGFFWEGMPDLNYDNQNVRNEIKSAGRFWLRETGIDGYRLDAAQHIYDATEISKNVAWWKEFRTDMSYVNPYAFYIGEVWNKDSVVAAYLGEALSACFNFDLSTAITKAIGTGNAAGIADQLMQIRKLYQSKYPKFTDVIFISNHDQDRYRSTFQDDTSKTIQAFTILMTLPGIPFLYYGEEAGMTGKFPDHYRREPMPWKDASRTTWEKPIYSTEQKIMSVEDQMTQANSFYSRYKNLIAMRKADKVFSFGEPVACSYTDGNDNRLLAYDLKYEKRKISVIHNVSGQQVTLPKKSGTIKFINGGIVFRNQLMLPAGSSVIIE